MKAIYLSLFLCLLVISSFGQQLRDLNRPKIMVVNHSKELGLMSVHMLVVQILHDQISCAVILTMEDIESDIKFDRDLAIAHPAGEYETNLGNIAKKMDCDYIVDIGGSIVGDKYFFSSSMLDNRKAKAVNKTMVQTDYKNLVKEVQSFAYKLAKELLQMQICPYKGKITISNELEDQEIHDRGNRCGKNSGGYFSEHKENTTKKSETWILEKKKRIEAEGSFSTTFVEKKIIHQKSNACTSCYICDGKVVTGRSTTYTDEDWLVENKEEYKIEGIADPILDDKFNKISPAMVSIEFDTLAGTYWIKVKAISKPGTYTISRTEKRATACKCDDPVPDEKTSYVKIVPLDKMYGPFKGKPTDKTLQDTKNEVIRTKHDGGETIDTYKLNFSFTR